MEPKKTLSLLNEIMDSMPHKINSITTGLLALSGYLTTTNITPLLGVLAILIAIAVNIRSWYNKKKELVNIGLEKERIIIETKLAQAQLKNIQDEE